jgi:hypothetical protein
MATIKTFTAGTEITNITNFSHPTSRNTGSNQLGFHLLQYVSDGTAVSIFMKNQGGSAFNLQLIACADGLAPTSQNAKASDTIDLSAYGNATTFTQTVFSISSNYAHQIPFGVDSSDNLYVYLLRDSSTGGTYGGSTLLKISKPTEGWAQWEASSDTSLRVSSVTAETYTVYPATQSTTANPGSRPYHVFATYVCETVSDGIPYLVTFYSNEHPSLSSYNGAITYEVRNLNTGARTAQGNISSGNTYQGILSMSRPSVFAAGGVISYYNVSGATTANSGKLVAWQVHQGGGFTRNEYTTSSYSTTFPTWNEGLSSGSCGMIQFVSRNRFVILTRNGSGTNYVVSMVGVNWQGPVSDYSSSIPGQGGGSAPVITTFGSTITVSGTGGTYATWSNTSFTASVLAFPENNFIRIFNHNLGGYYDMNYTLNSGMSASLNANSYAFDDSFPTGLGGTSQHPGISHDNKILYLYTTPASSVMSFRYSLNNKDNAISYVLPVDGPSATSLIVSPTVSSINSNGGIKIELTKPSTAISVTGHGSTYWGRFTPSSIGYKFRRVDGETTTYLTQSSLTFGESEVDNNSASTPFLSASLDIPSAQWANAKNYNISLAYNYTVGNTSTYGSTKTITTVTPSTAPTSPTAKRFMRRAMPALTDSHEYTFDNNALVNRINIANYGAQATVAIKIGEFYILPPTTVASGAILNLDTSQRVDQNDRILITSSSSSIDIWISGTEGI